MSHTTAIKPMWRRMCRTKSPKRPPRISSSPPVLVQSSDVLHHYRIFINELRSADSPGRRRSRPAHLRSQHREKKWPTFSRCGPRRVSHAPCETEQRTACCCCCCLQPSFASTRSRINIRPVGCSPASRLSRRRPDPLNHCLPTAARLPHARRSARDARASSWALRLVIPRERLPVAPKQRIFQLPPANATFVLFYWSLSSETRRLRKLRCPS